MTDSADATKLNVDSNSKGVEGVSVPEKNFEFDGTPTALDKGSMMLTITHEAINDYKAAGTDQFKLADSGMVEFVELNTPAHYTIEVVGDQAMIKAWEDVGDVDVDNAPGGNPKDTAVVKKTDSVK